MRGLRGLRVKDLKKIAIDDDRALLTSTGTDQNYWKLSDSVRKLSQSNLKARGDPNKSINSYFDNNPRSESLETAEVGSNANTSNIQNRDERLKKVIV